jgi:hypothetical protein
VHLAVLRASPACAKHARSAATQPKYFFNNNVHVPIYRLYVGLPSKEKQLSGASFVASRRATGAAQGSGVEMEGDGFRCTFWHFSSV